MRIAVLASGGNSPGMNNAVLTLVKSAKLNKIDIKLIYDGYQGLIENKFHNADVRNLEDFSTRGNVVIGSARSKKFMEVEYKRLAIKNLKKQKVDVLVVIGGDGSYKGAASLAKLGMKVMALPGTIDNDVASTDSTIGFYSCLHTIVESIDKIRDSFDSHSGICFVEVMGRGFSDLAVQAGIASNAEAIVTSENIMNAEEFIAIADETKRNKKRSCIFVITEKIYGTNGLPTLDELAKEIEKVTGRVCRVNVIGHMQRGGVPAATDRY
jgi:6-phosphofructokinase 1